MKIPALNRLSGLQVFQVLRFGAPFVISVILVRLLNQPSIGVYESLVLIGTSFTFFWVSGIINTFIPYHSSVAENQQPKLSFNVYVLLLAFSAVCFAVLLGLRPVFFKQGSYLMQGHLYLYFLAYNLFNAPSFLMEYLLMVQNKPKTLVTYGIASFSLQVLALIVPLYLGCSLQNAVLVLAAYGLLKFLFMSGYVLNSGTHAISFSILKPFLAKAVPAMLALAVGGSMPYIDSYIVLHFFSKPVFAVYQYGAREMPLVLLMANALSNVFSGDIAASRMVYNMPESLAKLRQGSKNLMHRLFPLAIVLIATSGYLFNHVYSPMFQGSVGIFNVFLLLTISRLIFPQTVMTGLLKNREMFWFSSIEWVVNLVLDLVFLHYFGLIGIAWATVIAYYVERAIQMAFLNRIGHAPATYIPIKTWAGYSLAVIGVYVLVTVFH